MMLPPGCEQAAFRVKLADRREIAGAYALRHEVFCKEQALFACDRDAIDDLAITIVATSSRHQVIGTVRIHESEPSLWFGSRLAVLAAWRRRAGLGAALIRLAVGTARARGCNRFLAHVQAQHATMFEALHWQKLEECMLHGVSHWFMQADLEHYRPMPQTFEMTRNAA
jgi:putative N-acetyltransferase (TIGR04045 family)